MKQPMSIDFLQHSKFPYCLLAAALLAYMPTDAAASSISVPGATYNIFGQFVNANGTPIAKTQQTAGSFSISVSPSNSATAAAQILTEPFPSLSSSASVTAPTATQFSSNSYINSPNTSASMSYYIEFTGPTATVPILLNASLSVNTTGDPYDSSALAQFLIFNAGEIALNDELSIGSTNFSTFRGVQTSLSQPQSSLNLSDSGIWTADTNTLYYVQLIGNTEGAAIKYDPVTQSYDVPQSGSGSAFVDPTFQIASSVADPQDYSIILSSGVGNTPATTSIAPEPTTATLALCGAFATVCGVFRRRMKARGRSC